MYKNFPYYYNTLPGYSQVRDTVSDINLFALCCHNKIYQLWNKEQIKVLSGEIQNLTTSTVLEVAAGDGMLSHWLREYDIDIIATDDGSWKIPIHGEVEHLDAIEAIRKYNPEVVIASWLPMGELDLAILSEQVPNFITIGETEGGCTGSYRIWEEYSGLGYRMEYLESDYNICRTDHALTGRLFRHSTTTLFTLEEE